MGYKPITNTEDARAALEAGKARIDATIALLPAIDAMQEPFRSAALQSIVPTANAASSIPEPGKTSGPGGRGFDG